MKYQVDVYEVWVRSFTVEADSEAEATDIVSTGNVEEDTFEYSHTQEDIEVREVVA